MRYIDDAKDLARDVTLIKVKRFHSGEKDVSFLEILSTANRSYLRLFAITVTTALRNIEKVAFFMLETVASISLLMMALVVKATDYI